MSKTHYFVQDDLAKIQKKKEEEKVGNHMNLLILCLALWR